jgi:YD repeat-containing protein
VLLTYDLAEAVERTLENRLVFSTTTGTQFAPPPVYCESCSNAGVGGNGGAESEAPPLPGGLGPMIYGSDAQPHPTLNFNLYIDTDPAPLDMVHEVLKVESVGTLDFGDKYFELPTTAGYFTFSFQADAAALDSGREFWMAKISIVDPDHPDDASPFYHVRTYQDIINNDTSQFGAGWQLESLDHLSFGHLVDTSGHFNFDDHPVSLVTGDNQVIRFDEADEDSDYINYDRESGTPYSLCRMQYDKDSHEYTVTNPDDSKSVFNSTGQLIVRKDHFGNEVEKYTYDISGNLSTKEDQWGNFTTLVRNGDLLTITDFCDEYGNPTMDVSQTAVLEFDGYNLISVTQPDPDGDGPLVSPVTRYDYTGDLLTTIVDPRNAVTTISKERGRRAWRVRFRRKPSCASVPCHEEVKRRMTTFLSTSGIVLCIRQMLRCECSDNINLRWQSKLPTGDLRVLKGAPRVQEGDVSQLARHVLLRQRFPDNALPGAVAAKPDQMMALMVIQTFDRIIQSAFAIDRFHGRKWIVDLPWPAFFLKRIQDRLLVLRESREPLHDPASYT